MRAFRVAVLAGAVLVVAAAAVWIHHCGSVSRVHLGAVQSVRVELGRRTFDGTTTAAPVIRRLGRGGAQELADTLGTLGPPPSGTFACPMDTGLTDTFTFTAGSRHIVALDRVDGCATVTVSLPGRPDRVLSGSIDGAALVLLGLPPDFGRRR